MHTSAQFRVATLIIVSLLVFGSSMRGAEDKPVSEKDLIALIELQIDDAAITAKIQKGGLAFDVDDPARERLQKAGASDALLKAVQDVAKAKKPAVPGQAITYQDVLKLLTLGVDEDAILKRLEKSPTILTPSAAQVAQLKDAGASERLIAALQKGRQISAQAAELITDFAIVLDCSGSMKEMTKEGETKMVAAKRVVTDLVQKIPDGLNVTFVIYGHEVFGANDPRNCQAVKIVRPLSSLDAAGKSELSRLIAGLKPTGATPIALSLKTAGEELAKNDAYCGLVLITDGLETCQGDPEAEAVALASNLKLTFGVHVVGFGVKPDEDASLKEIAAAVKGKYYDADSAEQLADAIAGIAQELEVAARPPEKVTSNRRAIKVLKPEIEFPALEEIRAVQYPNAVFTDVKAKGGYGEEIRIPSGTESYDILWVPKLGHPVKMIKDFKLEERKVLELAPEKYLGLVQVRGKGKPAGKIKVWIPGNFQSKTVQECEKFGDIMVAPAGTYNVSVGDKLVEERLKVEPGKLYDLE